MASKREQILTPEGRLSFVNVFKPSSYEGGKETYNCVLIIPKTTNIEALKDAIRKCAVEAGLQKGARVPICDGDLKAEEWGEAFKDSWYMRASSQFKPAVVDAKKQEIIVESQVYSGCYGRLVVAPYSYDTKGNKGVSFGLDAVQVLRDGEKLGGSGKALALFGEVEGEAATSGGVNDLF